MGKKVEKCKAPGCSKWVVHEEDSGYCSEHQCKLDPISALYIDKTPEQMDYDDKVCQYFSWLLNNLSPEELMT